MTNFIAVASTKGGVGKTTVAINLAAALTKLNCDVLLVDGNLTTPNVSLYLGSPNLPCTLHDVLNGNGSVKDAEYIHNSGLKLIPASVHLEDINANHMQKMSGFLSALNGTYDTIIVDTVTGVNEESVNILSLADELIVVMEPNFPSVSESLKLVALSKKLNVKIRGFILNRVKDSPYELGHKQIEALLGEPMIGSIPDDENMQEALTRQHPIIHSHPNSKASYAFMKLAHNIASIPYDNLF